MTPTGVLYDPSDKTPIDTNEPSLVPNHQSRIWSQAAFAADMADDIFRAAITAAPRFCTVYRKQIYYISIFESFNSLENPILNHSPY
jgi:hypothetical protein